MASDYALPLAPSGADDSHHARLTTPHSRVHAHGVHSNVPIAGLGINEAAFSRNTHAGHSTHHSHSHNHNHNHDGLHIHEPSTPSKSNGIVNNLSSLGKSRSRARGESDLGRPPSMKGNAYRPSLGELPGRSTWERLPQELLAVFLVCLPLYTASLSVGGSSYRDVRSHQDRTNDVAHLRDTILELEHPSLSRRTGLSAGLRESLLLSSIILLGLSALTGTQSKDGRAVSTGYASPRMPTNKKAETKRATSGLGGGVAYAVGLCCLSIFLPIFAAIKLGGWRICLIVLSAHTAGLTRHTHTHAMLQQNASTSHLALWITISIAFVTDLMGLTSQAALADTALGYMAIISAASFTVYPLQSTGELYGLASSSSGRMTPISPSVASLSSASVNTDGGTSASDDHTTLLAAIVLLILAISASVSSGNFTITVPASNVVAGVVSIVAAILAAHHANISLLKRSPTKVAYSVGVLLLALIGLCTTQHIWSEVIGNIFLSIAFLVAVLLDARPTTISHPEHSREKHSNSQQHHHHHHRGEQAHSSFTSFLLGRCEPDSLIHSILREKDTRRIAYFTCLNFAFMLVQGLYGYLSGSLGLLSDTVHMFFDCLGLVVGLGAAVASNWPPSRERPFGWGKLNTLAGFGNGVFLMLVSVEFVVEALEGILEGRELRRVKELFVVSTLGLLVNMVGLFAFGHAHAGHDHGHGHGHSHDHKTQAMGEHDSHTPHLEDHGHAHNENMHGIFLHVAADAGGSLAVIISTALTIYKPWYLWDPVATIIIAILIFAAAVPLVISSGQKLLLIVPEETEYIIKNFLQEVGEVRGVLAYAAPRFWAIDEGAGADSDHKQGHDHGDRQNCDEPHDRKHEHHEHEHDHSHEDSGHDHHHSHTASRPNARLMGCIHITTVPFADSEDVRERIEELALSRGMRLVIHVEHDGETQCWYGSGQKS